MKKNTFFGYTVIVILSLLVVLFVGRSETGMFLTLSVNEGLDGFRKGMDISGGVRLNYKIDFSEYDRVYEDETTRNQIKRDVLQIIKQNLNQRTEGLGVSDTNVFTQIINEDNYVVVELGGINDLDAAKEVIGRTVQLQFKIAYQGDGSDVVGERVALAEELLVQAVNDAEGFARIVNGALQSEGVQYVRYDDVTSDELPSYYSTTPGLLDTRDQQVYATLVGEAGTTPLTVSKLTARETLTVSGSTQDLYTIEEIVVNPIPQRAAALDPQTNQILNGAFFKLAQVGQSQTGQPVATLQFDERGGEIFCNITGENVGNQLGIFVDGVLLTDPVINEKICGGSTQISGNYTLESVRELVDDLNNGAFPAPLELANEEKVSPSLGDQALNGSLLAGVVGIFLVFIYLTIQYGLRYGAIAVISIVSFLIVILAIIKLIPVALTTSGIAALLLSIGMGVDANILIYERIKEEQRNGYTGAGSIVQGYEKSWSAIFDGNVTTGVIAVILVFVGTNIFKGFGTMMVLNIFITLVVMVPYTKQLLLVSSEK